LFSSVVLVAGDLLKVITQTIWRESKVKGRSD